MLLTPLPELDVAFQAVPVPQELTIRVTAGGSPELPYGRWAAEAVVAMIARGAAGGSSFAPEAGAARLVSQSPTDPEVLAPTMTFHLEARGVDARFVRTIAEHFFTAMAPLPVDRLTIVGSASVDGAAASVRDARARDWLADPLAYPGRWGELGFAVTTRVLSRGAAVRIELEDDADEHLQAIREALSAWQFAVLTMPDLARAHRGHMDPILRVARTRREIFARAELFDHVPGPARDALLNVLSRVHRTVAKILHVDVGMP